MTVKVLVICMATLSSNGGSQCINRNIDSIIDIYGDNNTEIYRISCSNSYGFGEKLLRFKNILKGFYAGLDRIHEYEIIKLIRNKRIEIIYIDGSFYGKLAKIIKHRFPNIKIITFFHNCEFEYSFNALKASKRYINFYNPILCYYNEKIACQYSDEIIVLNDRDRLAIQKYYKRRANYIIPITFTPWYKPKKKILSVNKPLHALFVGSYFYGNVEGLKWFCKKILPNVNIHFTVVGSGMEQLSEDIAITEKLTIHGKVKDLSEFYENADLVILPILSGGGMKVKTAEALMFGKYIIGTPEAFMGYEMNNLVGKTCSTPQEFIETLNSLSLDSKFNKASRDLFDSKYSYQNSLEKFRKVFTLLDSKININ